MTVSAIAQASAEQLTETFGAVPTFVSCHNAGDPLRIDIALCADVPGDGRGSLGTVTLADHDLGFEATRLQIVALYPSAAETFSRAIGSCALNVVRRGWPLRWGAVHPDVLTLYELSSTLAHFLYVPAFSWPERLPALTAGEHVIEWLQAIPIAESERAFAEANGIPALEKLLIDGAVDITDLDRASVV